MKFIRNFYQSFVGIPPMFLDGCIAVGIAMLTAFSLGLAQEDSYKYMNSVLRFWLVLSLGSLVQGMHALSKFRDGTFQRHNDAKERRAIADETTGTVETTSVIKEKTEIPPTPPVP